jgi:hypothetical protein
MTKQTPIFQGQPSENALQLAARFAANAWEEPREVEKWDSSNRQFQLVDGDQWYRIGSHGSLFAVFVGDKA